ncbi:BspA family leucine-rich repeat surface protein [Mycoplasma feriruminatoris]|uniref:Uncharacterized protein n=1 Tax=Mycoplasma feriruminatoris TaxID=1179777 RepID=A0A654IN26_9MOLU|nr:hypothetical protein MF5583_00121 [Mycoplasma feriruminatoris]
MRFLLSVLFFSAISSISINFVHLFDRNDEIYFKMQESKPQRVKEKSHKYKKDDPTEIEEIGYYYRNELVTIKQIPPSVKRVTSNLPTEIQSLYGAFANRFERYKEVTGFESWDTSKITDMSYVFSNNATVNVNLSSWKTDQVTTMQGMFKGAVKFNNGGKPLNWTTSNVKSMESMFDGATDFNQDLKSWKVDNVIKNKNFSRGSGIFGNNDKKPKWNKIEEVNDPIEKKIEKKPEVIIHPSPTSPKRKVQIPIVKLVSPIIKPKPLANSTSKLNIPKSTMTQNQTSKKLSTPAIVGVIVGIQAILTSLGFGIPYIIKKFKK